MVKSMFAGVAGLRAHQSKMDVIGNNIANVNTWGYKAANMSFKDAMYQSTSAGSSGNTEDGGYGAVNANQIGYGVTTGSITYDFGTGGMSPSSNGLDCMIDGTGFFLVGPMINGGSVGLDTDDAIKSSGLYLSRVGKFKVDPNGYLVDDSGNYVYGFKNAKDWTSNTEYATGVLSPLKIPTKADMEEISKNKTGSAVTAARTKLEEARAALNSANLALGTARQNYFEAQAVFDAAVVSNEIEKTTKELTALKDTMDKAYAEWNDKKDDSSLKKNYEDAKLAYDEKNFELITKQANIRAPKAKAAYTADELKAVIDDYSLRYTELQAANPATNPADYDTKKKALEAARTKLEAVQTALTKLEEDSIEGKRDAAEIGIGAAQAKVDAAKRNITTAEGNLKEAEKANASTQGTSTGNSDDLAEFANYKIQEDGTVVGTTTDNINVFVGKIALGSVPNTGGLEKDSGYYYSVGASAGNVSVYEAGGTQGRILGNYLEMAKVDLATEMTDMITTQRGFQANSKIITVTDQMLEELVNMKR